MRGKLLWGALVCCASFVSAKAADLPARQAPPVYIPPPLPVFSWSGLYVGGQVGYAFGEDHAINQLNGPNGRLSHPEGIIGGGHVGYNFESIPALRLGTNGLLLGIEGDVDGTNYRDTYGDFRQTTLRSDIQGSVRGRIGLAFERVLFYATGGAAFASFQDDFQNPAFATFAHTRVGNTVGGGVKYALTNQWSVRAEYRYSDFGTYTEIPNGLHVSRHETMERAQAGISYRFATPAAPPVVARY